MESRDADHASCFIEAHLRAARIFADKLLTTDMYHLERGAVYRVIEDRLIRSRLSAHPVGVPEEITS